MIRRLILVLFLILASQTAWSNELSTEQPMHAPDSRNDGYRCFAQANDNLPLFQPMKERGFGYHGSNDAGMAKQRKHLEQLRLLKLLDLLELGEDQELEFIAAFSAIRRKLRDLDREKSDLVNRLSEGLREKTMSDSEIHNLIDSLAQTDKRKLEKTAEFQKKVKGILTAKQLGKLVVFNDRFEFELLERIRAFRERNPGGRGAGPGSGSGMPGDCFENSRFE